jgi:carbonic anhydrase/acetyltransferase-like protein (isoleucine patch superfamily)
MGAIVMDGAVIEPGGMLAAGAMLTPGKRVPSGELWAGRPAKKMRDLTEDEKIFNQRSAAHYVEVARAHRLGAAGAPFGHDMNVRPLPPR